MKGVGLWVLLSLHNVAWAQPSPEAGTRPLVHSEFTVGEIRSLANEAEALSSIVPGAEGLHADCLALAQSLNNKVQNPPLWLPLLRSGREWSGRAGESPPELRLRTLLAQLRQAYWQLNADEE